VVRESYHRLPSARRERLLAATVAEIEAHGLGRASMNRILERAGLSKGVAYHYFADRDDLLATVMRDGLATALGDLAIDPAALSAETFWDDIAAAMLASGDPARWDPRVIALLRAVWALPMDRRAEGSMAELWAEMTGLVRTVIARGRELGAIRRDLDESLLVALCMDLGQTCDRWFLEHWDRAQPEDMRRHGLATLDLFRRLLEPPLPQVHGGRAAAPQRRRR
jgi:TetR/AcrR family transcriptional regulator, transcriptional repressor of aconitase